MKEQPLREPLAQQAQRPVVAVIEEHNPAAAFDPDRVDRPVVEALPHLAQADNKPVALG